MNDWQIIPNDRSIDRADWIDFIDQVPELTILPGPSFANPFNVVETVQLESWKASVVIDSERVGLISWTLKGVLILDVTIESDEDSLVAFLKRISKRMSAELRPVCERPIHNAYTTTLSAQEIVDCIERFPEAELDLVESRRISDFGDTESLSIVYREHFDLLFEQLDECLGGLVYLNKSGKRVSKEWLRILPEDLYTDSLAVWQVSGKKCYLRLEFGEKEQSILIAFGVEGCESSGLTYS